MFKVFIMIKVKNCFFITESHFYSFISDSNVIKSYHIIILEAFVCVMSEWRKSDVDATLYIELVEPSSLTPGLTTTRITAPL